MTEEQREGLEFGRIRRQRVRLLVGDHLDAMFRAAKVGVRLGQRLAGPDWNAAGFR